MLMARSERGPTAFYTLRTGHGRTFAVPRRSTIGETEHSTRTTTWQIYVAVAATWPDHALRYGVSNGLCAGQRALHVWYACYLRQGLLYIASSYDYPILFHGAFGPEQVERSVDFYLSVYDAPLSVKALIHAVMGLGLVGIVTKIVRWQENDKYFGSASLALYFGSILMYISISIPNMRVLARPDDMPIVHRAVFDADAFRKVEDYEFKPLSLRETTSVVQVLGATNVIITALLSGVLLMQAGEWYASRLDRIAENKQRQASIAKLGAQRGEDKKSK